MKKRRLVLMLMLVVTAMTASVCVAETFTPESLARQRCAACHKTDAQGRLDVIEETRKSTEEWKHVVDRMVRLNGAPIADADFYPIVKELSLSLGLTPQEMAQVAYYNSEENSQYREIPKNDEEKRLYTACVRCHTYAKIVSHRMTESQWAATRDLHLGYYPTVVPQMREMDWAKESQELVPILSKKFPFKDAGWENWMKDRKPADLSGSWNAAGYQPGMGYYTGTYAFTADSSKGRDEYRIERKVIYTNGTVLTMQGEGTLFGTYHLRCAFAPTPLTGRIEGVFDLNADTMGFTGKWWTVVQDTNAYGNETVLMDKGPLRVIAAFPNALKADPGLKQTLTVSGVSLPGNLTPADFSFSNPGVKVKSVGSQDKTQAVCVMEVAKNAAVGPMTLKVKGAAYAAPLLVYDRIDDIRILPALGRARVSCGAAYPPQGVQFVARGVHFGPDQKPDTPDDWVLEPVEARWWLEEEKTRENDDDLKYLTTSIHNGLYTPATTYGPIEERGQRREGTGLIAVGASFKEGDKEFKGRAKLAVTVPDFVTHIK